MKKFLIAAVAVATIAGAAGAASAQTYGAPHGPDRGYSDSDRGGRGGYDDRGGHGFGAGAINAKQNAIAQRINQGERSGRLDRREVRTLRGELAQISSLERQFQRSRGLDRREVSILSTRLDRLERQVMADLRDGRGPRGGYGGGHDGGYRPH